MRRFLGIGLFILTLYGVGRLYFFLTAGFIPAHISSNLHPRPEWAVRSLSADEYVELEQALTQPYRYLGKGCQSYVFASDDGKYVIKFFKYQHVRLAPWLTYFPPLPAVVQYRKEKLEKKWRKLDSFFRSWKLVFDHLKNEAGLVFVHLNKTDTLNRQLTLYDKLGRQHLIDLDHTEFCIQRRAELLCDVILRYRDQADLPKAQELVDNILALILSEYSKGLADIDHALMQNTGVVNGRPMHIDVGLFTYNEDIQKPLIYKQELFTKTYKLKQWLILNYPELGEYLDQKLQLLIGHPYPSLQPKYRLKCSRLQPVTAQSQSSNA